MTTVVTANYESNDLSEHPVVVANGAGIATNAGAALGGSNFGLQLSLAAGIFEAYGQNTINVLPTQDQTDWTFRIDPNALTILGGDTIAVLRVLESAAPPGLYLDVYLTFVAGNYQIFITAYDDDGTLHSSSSYTISDAEHLIRVIVNQTDFGESDGTAELWIDGVLQETVAGIDNFLVASAINTTRFGAIGAEGS